MGHGIVAVHNLNERWLQVVNDSLNLSSDLVAFLRTHGARRVEADGQATQRIRAQRWQVQSGADEPARWACVGVVGSARLGHHRAAHVLPANHGITHTFEHTVNHAGALAALLGHLGGSHDGRFHIHTGRVILSIFEVASAVEATAHAIVLVTLVATRATALGLLLLLLFLELVVHVLRAVLFLDPAEVHATLGQLPATGLDVGVDERIVGVVPDAWVAALTSPHVHHHNVAGLVQHKAEQLLVSQRLAELGVEPYPCAVGSRSGHLVRDLALDAGHNGCDESLAQSELAVCKVDAVHKCCHDYLQ